MLKNRNRNVFNNSKVWVDRTLRLTPLGSHTSRDSTRSSFVKFRQVSSRDAIQPTVLFWDNESLTRYHHDIHSSLTLPTRCGRAGPIKFTVPTAPTLSQQRKRAHASAMQSPHACCKRCSPRRTCANSTQRLLATAATLPRQHCRALSALVSTLSVDTLFYYFPLIALTRNFSPLLVNHIGYL